jgi:DICT domain-containing protein
MSHYLESHALAAAEPPVLLAAFEHVRHFTPATARRYERLATHCSFVAALGAGLPERPADGVRGADLPPGDPLTGEWVVTTVGPHFAGALVARDLGDSGEDADRRFAFVVTHDHDVVLRAGRALLGRIAPSG